MEEGEEDGDERGDVGDVVGDDEVEAGHMVIDGLGVSLQNDCVHTHAEHNMECGLCVCGSTELTGPDGEELDWVECDACDNWYHWTCVGFDPKKYKKGKKFYCPRKNCQRYWSELKK